MTNDNTLSIQEGSINFWIKENSLHYGDGKITPVLNLSPQGGSIMCVKDSDNKLKFFFVVLGKGRADTEFDVAKIDEAKRHMVSFTWNLKQKELNFYFDGKKEVTKTLDW